MSGQNISDKNAYEKDIKFALYWILHNAHGCLEVESLLGWQVLEQDMVNRGLSGPRAEKILAKGGRGSREEADLWRPRKRTFVRGVAWDERREPCMAGRAGREIAL